MAPTVRNRIATTQLNERQTAPARGALWGAAYQQGRGGLATSGAGHTNYHGALGATRPTTACAARPPYQLVVGSW